MVTFIGEPKMLVRFNPPIGNVKAVRFNEEGRFTTENPRMIQRFHHKFDSIPSKEEPSEELIDDLEYQDHRHAGTMYTCKKCDFSTENKGKLMAHYREFHKKEGQDEDKNSIE